MRATPRASRSQIAGIGQNPDGRAVLAVRIAAPPAEGAANAALVALFAATLGVRKRDVTIQTGESGRNKQVHIAGDCEALIALLVSLTAFAA